MKSLILLTLLGMLGCSSQRKLEERDNIETIERDFKVRDASSRFRPGWIEDAEEWAQQNKQDNKKFRFFSFETGPKVDREIACDLAKANAKSDIAGEISSFIEQTLASSREGQASLDESNPNNIALKEYVESDLALKTMAMINGASIVKRYWEKRKYEKDLGAKRDFTAYTCAVFVRMKKDNLKRAIERATQSVVQAAQDPETKGQVKKALKDVTKKFMQSKQGLI